MTRWVNFWAAGGRHDGELAPSIILLVRLLNISDMWPFHEPMRDRGPQKKNSGVFKKARPARPQPLGRAERTDEYVSTAKG